MLGAENAGDDAGTMEEVGVRAWRTGVYLGYLLLLHQGRFPRRDGSRAFLGAEDGGSAGCGQILYGKADFLRWGQTALYSSRPWTF